MLDPSLATDWSCLSIDRIQVSWLFMAYKELKSRARSLIWIGRGEERSRLNLYHLESNRRWNVDWYSSIRPNQSSSKSLRKKFLRVHWDLYSCINVLHKKGKKRGEKECLVYVLCSLAVCFCQTQAAWGISSTNTSRCSSISNGGRKEERFLIWILIAFWIFDSLLVLMEFRSSCSINVLGKTSSSIWVRLEISKENGLK